MVLLDQIVQVLRGPDIRVLRQQAIGLHLAHRAVRGGIPIERGRLWRLALMFDCLAEKGFGRGHVVLRSEHELYRLAGSIYRTIQINPCSRNLQVGFVKTL
jgi:hypothetical protein